LGGLHQYSLKFYSCSLSLVDLDQVPFQLERRLSRSAAGLLPKTCCTTSPESRALFDRGQCASEKPDHTIYLGGGSRLMRALCLAITASLFAATHSALAESKWLDGRRLDVAEIRALCDQVDDVRLLARMQMISAGKARWRRLSRQKLVIEAAAMGVPPLDPDRCYVIARGGSTDEGERSAFEVRDFIVSPERTSVFTIGHAYDAPEGWVYPDR
jgi:hypothetical protein